MAGERILVTDDHAHIRDFVASILRMKQYEVLTATNGAEAMQIILAAPPDALILDLEMPRMNGLEVLDALQKEHIDLPVILMTGKGSEQIAVEVFRKGVKDYVIKGDADGDNILKALERVLAFTRLRREKEELLHSYQTTYQYLQHRLHEMNILYHLSRSMVEGCERQRLESRILKAIEEVMDVKSTGLYLLENNQLTCLCYKTHASKPVFRPKWHDPLAAQCVASGETVHGTQALAVPLVFGAQTIGALVVHGSSPNGAYEPTQEALLRVIADYAALGESLPARQPAPRTPARQYQVFISYSRKDFDPYVVNLLQLLREHGITYWLDQADIAGGQDWRKRIWEALDSSLLMLLCLSPRSIASAQVKNEYSYYLDKSRPVIPVLLEPTVLPPELHNLHHIPYPDVGKLIDSIRQALED